MWIFALQPPRDLPMLCGPLFLGSGAVGMHLGAGAVEAEAVEVLVRQLLLPQRRKQPRQHARLGPAAQPHVDRVPLAVALGKGAPLAAVPKNVQQGVLLFGDAGHDWELLACFFHCWQQLATDPISTQALTGPNPINELTADMEHLTLKQVFNR